jgi:hypothetical protein
MKSTLTFVGLTALWCAVAAADTPPPASRVPLATILQNVERHGYQAVTEISFDDGEWEVEAMEGTKPVGLRIVPATGEIRSVHADEPHPAIPAKALPIADLLKSLETAGYTAITKFELEPSGWEVDCLKTGMPRELVVDPMTAKVLSDRADD